MTTAKASPKTTSAILGQLELGREVPWRTFDIVDDGGRARQELVVAS